MLYNYICKQLQIWSESGLEFTTSIIVNLKGLKKKEEVGRSPIAKYIDCLIVLASRL
jgi:hypothetical protein